MKRIVTVLWQGKEKSMDHIKYLYGAGMPSLRPGR